MKTTEARHESMVAELASVLRDKMNGRGSARYDQFRAAYLTTKGEQIAESAQPHTTDAALRQICDAAIKAGY